MKRKLCCINLVTKCITFKNMLLTAADLFFRVNDPGTPCGTLPKTSSVKSRDSIKSTPNPELQILKTSLEKEHKKNKELKSSLDDKSKSILKLQSERDELENEKALYETERKVVVIYVHIPLLFCHCCFSFFFWVCLSSICTLFIPCGTK